MLRLLALALLTTTVAAAQPVISVRLGLDGNQVSGLTDWQDRDRVALNARGIAVAETDSFPSFPSVQVDAGLQLSPTRRATAHVGYGSTSGRLDYSDYSGRARADRRARRLFVGASGEVRAFRAGPAALWAIASGRVSRVTVDYDREIVLTDGTVVESVSEMYTGWPVSVEPALAIELSVGSLAFFRVQGGWELAFGGALSGPSDPDASVPWEGYRVGVSVGARL